MTRVVIYVKIFSVREKVDSVTAGREGASTLQRVCGQVAKETSKPDMDAGFRRFPVVVLGLGRSGSPVFWVDFFFMLGNESRPNRAGLPVELSAGLFMALLISGPEDQELPGLAGPFVLSAA
ncbi:hypothetical protein ACIBQX_03060 [Nonomuraea sp. NPDC049714]|uniref:hypothetical protein n=1 Tax=Nonomuraea sp. NPDC049714 TaxID=3364357 RepID=UPI0037BB7BBC